jgi:hypothetical protein
MKEVEGVKEIMHDNIKKMTDNMEKLEVLDDKTSNK